MKPRVIALYLPQFHPIPENDEWWGKGFTEWTNVGKAKPLFRGHYQPRVPADLGYYDLRVPETREAQAQMARENGVEGFCYWHYWFGNGKRLLERPFNEVLKTGKPDFPFCLAWANESWKGFYHGVKNRNVLIEQLYPGKEDYINHFYEVLPAFKDKRYIRVDNKPLFMIYKPLGDSEVIEFINIWRILAKENDLEGIYFVGHNNILKESVDSILATGVDAVNTVRIGAMLKKRNVISKVKDRFNSIIRKVPMVYSYESVLDNFVDETVDSRENVFPSIVPGWDHSPRTQSMALIFTNNTPQLFDKHVKQVLELLKNKKTEQQVVFIKSWNEWAEGNYMEPDISNGTKFLEVLKKNING